MPMAGGSTFVNATTNPDVPAGTHLCVEIITNSMPVSMFGPTSLNPMGGTTVCELADAMGEVIGIFDLLVAGMTSGQQISMRGCIDFADDNSCTGDPLSQVIFVSIL